MRKRLFFTIAEALLLSFALLSPAKATETRDDIIYVPEIDVPVIDENNERIEDWNYEERPFEVEISSEDAPLPQELTMTTNEFGIVRFSPIELHVGDTYTYDFVETGGDYEGVTYDTEPHEIVITVDSVGLPSATWDGVEPQTKHCEISNTYETPLAGEPDYPDTPDEPSDPPAPEEPSQDVEQPTYEPPAVRPKSPLEDTGVFPYMTALSIAGSISVAALVAVILTRKLRDRR